MCILLKLHYAKFDVSRLFCSKVIEEKPWRGRLDPSPVGKGRVKHVFSGRQVSELYFLFGKFKACVKTCLDFNL